MPEENKIKLSEALQKMKEAQKILKHEFEQSLPNRQNDPVLEQVVSDAIGSLGDAIGIVNDFVNGGEQPELEDFAKGIN